MKKSKRLFVLLPAVIMALAGCGDTSESGTTTSTGGDTTTTTSIEVAQPVVITSAEHGSVTADKTEAMVGDQVTFSISVDEEYNFVDFKVNGNSVVVKDGKAVVTMVEGGLTATLEVKALEYNVLVNNAEHGKVTADKSKAAAGEKVTFTVAPDDDYELKELLINGSAVAVSGNKAEALMVKEGLTVTPSFTGIKHPVTIEANENGKVEANVGSATTGTEIKLVVTPNDDYELTELLVNGSAVAVTDGKAKVTMVKEGLAVSATFNLIKHAVTIATATNGSVTADKTETTTGDKVTFTVTPDDDYQVASFKVNGADVALDDSGKAEVAMIKTGLNAEATFVGIQHDVTIATSENGVVTADKSTAVTGEDVTLTLTPAEGYNVRELKVNDEVVTVTDNKAVVKMVKEGLNVTATFTDFTIVNEISETLVNEVTSKSVAKVELGADTTFASALPLATSETIFDLGGHTLTITNPDIIENANGKKVTLRNGTIVVDCEDTTKANLIDVSNAAEFVMSDVTLNNEHQASGITAALHISNATLATITDSTIDFKGNYGITTNNVEGENGKLVIKNSTVTVTSESDYDCVALLVNTVGTQVEIDSSVFTGDRQGIVARTGTWTISNTTAIVTNKWLKNSEDNVTTNNSYLEGTWKTGNEVPSAPYVIGDANANAYNENVTVTFDSSLAILNGAAQSMVVRGDGVYTTTVNLDAATYVNLGPASKTDDNAVINVNNVIETTVEKLLAMTESDSKNIYVVKGIIGEVSGSYGNTTLVDDNGKALTVYGAYVGGNGEYYYNYEDELYLSTTDSKALSSDNAGKYAIMMGTFDYYTSYSGTTPELKNAVVYEMARAVTSAPTVEVNDATMGSATLSKTEDVMLGDVITVTATPTGDNKLATVEVTDKFGNVIDVTETMSFKAGLADKVKVTFVDKDTPITKKLTVTAAKLCTAADGAKTCTLSGITFTISNGGFVDQARVYKNAKITITSKTLKIKSIEFTCTAKGTNKFGPGCFTSTEGTYTYSDYVGTWVSAETDGSSSLTLTASKNQVRITTMVITVVE